MRRSRSIKLTLLSSVGVLTLLACDQQDPLAKSGFVADERECAKNADADQCRQMLQDARAEHMKSAPAFASKDACEEKFGAANCEPQTKVASAGSETKPPGTGGTPGGEQSMFGGGTGMFVPMMMGFMMGRMMGGGYSSQPVYRDANNTAYARTGAGSGAGYSSVGSFDKRMSAPARPTQVAGGAARGGFGQEGAARSSTGSGSAGS
jgi:uncharacterized protein YgiB involved in biofilm formation